MNFHSLPTFQTAKWDKMMTFLHGWWHSFAYIFSLQVDVKINSGQPICFSKITAARKTECRLPRGGGRERERQRGRTTHTLVCVQVCMHLCVCLFVHCTYIFVYTHMCLHVPFLQRCIYTGTKVSLKSGRVACACNARTQKLRQEISKF